MFTSELISVLLLSEQFKNFFVEFIDSSILFVFLFHSAPLDNENGKKKTILKPDPSANSSPLSLSMDWLNNHLYILEEIRNPVSIQFIFN